MQWQHVGLLLYGIVSSAAALTIIITLTVLFLTAVHWKPRCSFSAILLNICVRNLLVGEPGSGCGCRLLRSGSGSRTELLLLGILLSSSSVLISGLDGASLSSGTFGLLCSVSPGVGGPRQEETVSLVGFFCSCRSVCGPSMWDTRWSSLRSSPKHGEFIHSAAADRR